MLQKSNFFIAAFVLMTSCQLRASTCCCHEPIEIPCAWQNPLGCGMNDEDPCCFLWWEALRDPLLSSLIRTASYRNRDILIASKQSREKVLQAVNNVSFEVAKSYIELRGLQMRLKPLAASIEVQKEIFTTRKGLASKGFFNKIEENEDKKNLNPLLAQKALLEVSIQKAIFHLTTLLAYHPGVFHENLCQPQDLPTLPCNIPVGSPWGLICRNPTVQEDRKTYEKTRCERDFLNYQKSILNALENTESALAAFQYERERFQYLETTRKIKAESYQLTKDLFDKGSKDERDVLNALQEYLVEENAHIQSKVDLLVSYITLYQTLGGGWEVCYCLPPKKCK